MTGPGGTAVQGSGRTGGGNIEKRETRTRAILGISDSVVVSLQNRSDRGRMNNHHGQGQQSSEGKHDDDAPLTDFLASLMEYAPTVLNGC